MLFYLNDRFLAEEVCQDTFVRLMTSGTQLEPGHEKAWLLKVALNRCRDLWRSGWVKRVVLGSPVFELIPAEDTQERRDDEEAMMTAVHRLPPPFREVILLFYYQNFGISEIAEMLSLPEGTISRPIVPRAREAQGNIGRRRCVMKDLENLKEIADRNLGGLQADTRLLHQILHAPAEKPKPLSSGGLL